MRTSALIIFCAQLLWINFCFATKYKYSSIQPCEKCEENSKIFYEMENIKLCSRCALEYLSFNFATQDVKTIKFYMKDIIYHEINDKKHNTCKWKMVSNAVDTIFTKTTKNLKDRKKKKKNFNLFLLANAILEKTFQKQKFLKRRVCAMCSLNRYSLMQTQCCHKQICIACYFSIENEKCMICSKKVCKNANKLLKSLFSAVQKMMHLETDVIKSIPESFMNNILQKQQQQCCLPTQQQVEEIIKYSNQQIVIPWRYILEPDTEYERNLKMPGIICGSLMSTLTTLSQIAICQFPQDDLQSVAIWIITNSFLSKNIVNTQPFHSWSPHETKILPKELHIKINAILIEFDRYLLNWMNFLYCYFLFGPQFYTQYELLLYVFLFAPPFLFIHKLLLQYLHEIAMEAILYEFY